MISTPIKPSDINTNKHLWDAFGNCETEVSAGWIVRYLQEIEEKTGEFWVPFTYDQIEEFYARSGKLSGFTFNRLLNWQGWGSDDKPVHTGTRYIEIDSKGNMQVTIVFVAACYKSSAMVKEAE